MRLALALLFAFVGAGGARAASVEVHVETCLPPVTAGLRATASGGLRCITYLWTLSGGTITAGQGTNAITFTSGPPGTIIQITARATCAPAVGYASAATYPTAQAAGDAAVCPGLGARLTGSGGAGCEWTPAEGLDDPHSCTPVAYPSQTTTYNLVVGGPFGCASTNDAAVTVAVSPGPDHALTVDSCLPPDTPDHVASVSGGPGESYVWQVSGGVITSGQSTNSITFASGPPGSRMQLSVDVTGDTCAGPLARRLQVDFGDVPPGDIFRGDICTIGRHGITAGCGGGDFCRNAAVRRDQMAVFLLKARHGGSYRPPPCSGIFNDVPCPGPFTDWVEQLNVERIGAGCGSGNYCPDSAVTRAQMALLLLTAKHGSSYRPPVCAGAFGDVPCPSLFADWIEQLHAEAITAGCQASPPLYCPDAAVTRGQMATFLVKTFGLQ
jgi:hypothetical protein